MPTDSIIKRVSNKLKRVVGGGIRRERIIKELGRGKILDKRRDLQDLLGAPALINDPEVATLQKYAGLAEKIIAEIGCAYGGSSLLFLLGKKEGIKVYSIDPFVVDSMGDFQATQKLCYGHVTRVLRRLGKAARIADWTLLPDYSFNAVKKWQAEIDVLFIDGDHRYASVRQDFIDWLPKVKRGGYIIFHDSCQPIEGSAYDHGWPGPSQLARELKSDSNVKLVEQVFSLSIFKKQ